MKDQVTNIEQSRREEIDKLIRECVKECSHPIITSAVLVSMGTSVDWWRRCALDVDTIKYTKGFAIGMGAPYANSNYIIMTLE